jgi:hypothetical protein
LSHVLALQRHLSMVNAPATWHATKKFSSIHKQRESSRGSKRKQHNNIAQTLVDANKCTYTHIQAQMPT